MPTPKISTTPKSFGSSNVFSFDLLEPITPKIQKTARVLCTVNAILPPSENELEINNIYPVVEAREILESEAPGQGLVDVIHDPEVNRPVLEVEGKAKVTFPTRTLLKDLVIYMKQTMRFFSITIKIVDTDRKKRVFVISNHRSVIKIEKDRCELPMSQSRGWQYVGIPLEDFTARAFGAKYQYTTEITVEGGLRLYKMFFQDRQYSDAELPAHLRVVSSLGLEI